VDNRYLPPAMGGKWAVSRHIHGTYISLVERSYMDDESDIETVFQGLGIPVASKNIDRYFPQNNRGKRCPALELLELFARIGMIERDEEKEIGV